MRLFAAVVPPAEVLDSLAEELTRLGAGSADDRLRWTPRARWHLTLAFYGEDDVDARARWLRDRLAGCVGGSVRFAGAGMFAGVLWVGARGGLDALSGLAERAGADVAERPYHPHLTIARWKGSRRPQAARRLVEGLAGYKGPTWPVRQVVLMRSHLGRGGPAYTVRERFDLSS